MKNNLVRREEPNPMWRMMRLALFVSLFVLAPALDAQTAAIDGMVTDPTSAVKQPTTMLVPARFSTTTAKVIWKRSGPTRDRQTIGSRTWRRRS